LERAVRGTATSVFIDSNASDPTITSLPEIDGDPGFQLLLDQDREIDQVLDDISKGVGVLKEMAHGMSQEIEMQEAIIDELDTKVEKNVNQLLGLNKRMKKTLENVRKADRFCIDLILFEFC